MTTPQLKRFEEPVLLHAGSDFVLLQDSWTVHESIEHLRLITINTRVFYFYVQNEAGRLVGVVPTRRLLVSAPEQQIADLMLRRVVAIPHTATVFDACEFFVLHKFFALPIVDEQRRVLGVVDIGLVTEEVLQEPETSAEDAAKEEAPGDVFESLGFHLQQLRNAGPRKAFRFRMPWLIVTLASGLTGAFITGLFQKTIAHFLILAFFSPLVLGLGESVGMQAMVLTIQALRANRPTVAWYLQTLRREAQTAALLGLACGGIVGAVIGLLYQQWIVAAAIALSVVLSLETACFLGLTIPSLLHAFKLDPKIAAGPITLAMGDIATMLYYFGIAAVWLGA